MNKIELKYAIPVLSFFVLLLFGFVSIHQEIVIKETILWSGLLFSIMFTFLFFFIIKEKFNILIKLSVGVLCFCIGYLVFLSSISILTFYVPGEEVNYESEISYPVQRKNAKSSLPCLYNGNFKTKDNDNWFTICINESQFKDLNLNKKIKIIATTKQNLFGYTLVSTKIVN